MGSSISNLIPGLDISSIIAQTMAVESQPLLQLQNQVASFQAKQQSVAQIQADITALQQAAQQLTLSATVGAKSLSTDLSGILTGTAGSGATNGTYSVTVKQLATATSVTSGSPDGVIAPAIGSAVNPTALLASAGLGTPVTNGTFTINGVAITVDANSKLSDPMDPANSLVAKINASGAGVTAQIVNDQYGRPNQLQLISNSGRSIQLGSQGDTSNFLSATGLSTGAIIGKTAANVTGTSAAAGAISATITINGSTVNINQTNAAFTGAQNAAFIRDAINAAKVGVTAAATGGSGDQVQITQNVLGSQGVVALTIAGANAGATGLTTGTTQNGTDQVTSSVPLGQLSPTTALSGNNFATALVPDGSGGGTFTLNGTTITWSQSDSLNNVLARINASSAGVQASYDAFSDRVTFSSTQTGGTAIAMQDVSGNLLQALHVMKGPSTSQPQQLGQNAIVDIAGVNGGNDIVLPTNTVTNYIPGVTLTLQKASTTPVNVTIGQDTATTTTAVQNLVTALNTAFTDINTATHTDQDPTKSGVLAGDMSLQGVENMISGTLNSIVGGASSSYQDLSTIGISTGKIGSPVSQNYAYQLDATKLAAALQANPNAVQQLLIGTQSSPGIATTLNTYLNGLIGPTGLFASRLQSITSSTTDLNNQITTMQTQLNDRQTMLRTQYAQLQSMLVALQSQGNAVSAQIAAMTASTVPSTGH